MDDPFEDEVDATNAQVDEHDGLFGDEDMEPVAEPAQAASNVPAGDAKDKAVDPSMRVTSRYMTKYERARLLGTRALQLRFVLAFCTCHEPSTERFPMQHERSTDG